MLTLVLAPVFFSRDCAGDLELPPEPTMSLVQRAPSRPLYLESTSERLMGKYEGRAL